MSRKNQKLLAAVLVLLLTLGAQFFTYGPGRQHLRWYFHGDLAAVQICNRILDQMESLQIRQFLGQRYVKLNDALRVALPQQTTHEAPMVKVKDPPPIQMLVPGFQVHELPVALTNVNNVRYRRDGKLVALCYNGNIYVLSDTDGDGTEDTAQLFWKNEGSIRGPLGMVLTPENYPHGQGVILASKGKVSMIVDRDGDDVGDDELIVASGWQEIPQNVDAVGLTMADDGTLYFALGTANFANAYQVDEAGRAQYDLNSERGTVQRVTPDWTSRETICTGVRFPIAFAFNNHGDLFCTDQEGATWLPNGNPLDELLHVRLDGGAPLANTTGKQHFGFPPRHPRHNPSVIDEPSVFDYGPQHQSTCGFCFNRQELRSPDSGSATFGPSWWRGDALVCGESRGKLWRTKLMRTTAGYVADNQLLACLQMLTVDVCVAPDGDLVVACHSGPPDWGTGPEGEGKLFRIRMTDSSTPRPVAAWWSAASELQIAFDHPLDPRHLRGLAEQAKIEFGAHVRAGDRWENLVPPYAVVDRQLSQPRFRLAVHSAGLSPDFRTLTLHTQSMTQPVHHSLLLPIEGHTVELDALPNGIAASWTSEGATEPTWQGFLPHLNLEVCQSLLQGSALHATLWPLLEQPGVLKLETLVDYRNMLRPEVQFGEKLDHAWPPELVTLHITASSHLALSAAVKVGETTRTLSAKDTTHQTQQLQLDQQGSFVRLKVNLPTRTGVIAHLTANFSTAEDSTQRTLPLRRFFQPFLSEDSFPTDVQPLGVRQPIPELVDGNWGRGRKLFQDQRTMCDRCHAIEGQGSKIGPDLSHLVQRDYTSVVRDIVDPNRTINPDFLTHNISTVDGRVISGVIRSDGEYLLVGTTTGDVTRIARSDVETMNSTGISIMPQDLLSKLSEVERRELLTFLLMPPPSMPMDAPLEAPPVRTAAEVAEALKDSQPLPASLRPLKMILVDGVKDHGPGEHDYPAWQRVWAQLLSGAPGVEIETVREFPDDPQLKSADVLIFFQKGSFSFKREVELDRFLKRGGGAVFIHWAVNGSDRVEEFAKRIGLASWGGRISYRHGPLTLDVVNHQHPVMRNFERLELYDESYWKLTGDLNQVTVLATSQEDGQATPQVWLRDHDPGRVFVSIPGHYSWTFDDPLFRILLLRGIAWVAGQPVDRFNELATPGARMSN